MEAVQSGGARPKVIQRNPSSPKSKKDKPPTTMDPPIATDGSGKTITSDPLRSTLSESGGSNGVEFYMSTNDTNIHKTMSRSFPGEIVKGQGQMQNCTTCSSTNSQTLVQSINHINGDDCHVNDVIHVHCTDDNTCDLIRQWRLSGQALKKFMLSKNLILENSGYVSRGHKDCAPRKLDANNSCCHGNSERSHICDDGKNGHVSDQCFGNTNTSTHSRGDSAICELVQNNVINSVVPVLTNGVDCSEQIPPNRPIRRTHSNGINDDHSSGIGSMIVGTTTCQDAQSFCNCRTLESVCVRHRGGQHKYYGRKIIDSSQKINPSQTETCKECSSTQNHSSNTFSCDCYANCSLSCTGKVVCECNRTSSDIDDWDFVDLYSCRLLDCMESHDSKSVKCMEAPEGNYSSVSNSTDTCNSELDQIDSYNRTEESCCKCLQTSDGKCTCIEACSCYCSETCCGTENCECTDISGCEHSRESSVDLCGSCSRTCDPNFTGDGNIEKKSSQKCRKNEKLSSSDNCNGELCCMRNNDVVNKRTNDKHFDDDNDTDDDDDDDDVNKSEQDVDNSIATVINVKESKHVPRTRKPNVSDSLMSSSICSDEIVCPSNRIKSLGRKDLVHLASPSFSSDSAVTDTSSVCEWADESSDAAKHTCIARDIENQSNGHLDVHKPPLNKVCKVTSPKKLRKKVMPRSRLADAVVDCGTEVDEIDSDSSLEFTPCCTAQLLPRSRLGSQLSEKSTESDILSPQLSEVAMENENKSTKSCDLLTGLHYAIPFLSEKLKISLSNRLKLGVKSQRQNGQQPGSTETSGTSSDRGPGLSDGQNCFSRNSADRQTSADNKETDHEASYQSSSEVSVCSHLSASSVSSRVTNSSGHVTSTSDHVTDRYDHVTKYHHTVANTFQRESSQNQDFDRCSDSLGKLDLDEENLEAVSSLCIVNSGNHSDSNKPLNPHDTEIMEGSFTSIPKSISDILNNMENIDAIEGIFLSESDSQSESEYCRQSVDSDGVRVPSLFSTNSSDSGEADDEFECDCQHCQDSVGHTVVRGYCHGNSDNFNIHSYHCGRDHSRNTVEGQGRTMEASGGTGTNNSERSNFELWLPERDEEEGLYRISITELSPLEQLMNDRRNELEIMFENVILQMLAVHPDLLSDHAPPPVSKATINSLPSDTVRAEHIEQNLSCPICLCILVENETVTTLPCSHIFHPLCIQAWLIKSGTCPVCRHIL